MTTLQNKMVAIVGRPNVGKSALFNRIAGKNIAIVHDRPGVTRDRLVATSRRGIAPFDVMDTGGIGETIEDDFNKQVQAEARLALDVADLILFVVDGYQGVTPVDLELAKTLRKTTKHLVLVVNKMDSEKRLSHGAEFAKLGFTESVQTSAAHGHGIPDLIKLIGEKLELKALPVAAAVEPIEGEEEETDKPAATGAGRPLRIAIVGRPNAGKSSLVNALIGQQRTIVSDIAGTTRDAIDIPCEVNGKRYMLVDTAGLRRKAKIHDAVETFSAMQATRTIRRSDLCLLMVDATGITMQDRKVAQLIVDEQRPCIILLNKFDLYHPGIKLKDRMEELEESARREFFFMPYAPMLAISAKEGQFLEKIFKAIERVYKGAQNPPSTGALNRLLHKVVDSSPAALGRSGKAFKLLYATMVKEDHPSPIPVPYIVLFANRIDQLQDSFLRHLESVVRTEWPAEGLPFRWAIRGKEKKAEMKKK
jgi:GTPase